MAETIKINNMETKKRKFKVGDKVSVRVTKKITKLMFPVSYEFGFPNPVKKTDIIAEVSGDPEAKLAYRLRNSGYYWPECALTENSNPSEKEDKK